MKQVKGFSKLSKEEKINWSLRSHEEQTQPHPSPFPCFRHGQANFCRGETSAGFQCGSDELGNPKVQVHPDQERRKKSRAQANLLAFRNH